MYFISSINTQGTIVEIMSDTKRRLSIAERRQKRTLEIKNRKLSEQGEGDTPAATPAATSPESYSDDESKGPGLAGAAQYSPKKAQTLAEEEGTDDDEGEAKQTSKKDKDKEKQTSKEDKDEEKKRKVKINFEEENAQVVFLLFDPEDASDSMELFLKHTLTLLSLSEDEYKEQREKLKHKCTELLENHDDLFEMYEAATTSAETFAEMNGGYGEPYIKRDRKSIDEMSSLISIYNRLSKFQFHLMRELNDPTILTNEQKKALQSIIHIFINEFDRVHVELDDEKIKELKQLSDQFIDDLFQTQKRTISERLRALPEGARQIADKFINLLNEMALAGFGVAKDKLFTGLETTKTFGTDTFEKLKAACSAAAKATTGAVKDGWENASKMTRDNAKAMGLIDDKGNLTTLGKASLAAALAAVAAGGAYYVKNRREKQRLQQEEERQQMLMLESLNTGNYSESSNETVSNTTLSGQKLTYPKVEIDEYGKIVPQW